MSESHAANTGGTQTFTWKYDVCHEYREYSIDDEWREVGGVFLFVAISFPHRGSIERRVLYVEATTSFARSIPNHPMLPKARRLAGDPPLINVHARVEEDESRRFQLEYAFLDHPHPPPLNRE